MQNDTNLAGESRTGAEHIPSVQPVIPLHLTEDRKPVTRTALARVWSPSARPETSVPSGVGAATVSVLAAPHKSIDAWMMGARPIVQAPTITRKTPGSDVWGVGQAFVVGELAGPIVARTYVDNVNSGSGMSGHGGTGVAPAGGTGNGLFTVNPVAHYRFGDGWFVSGAPAFADDKLPDGADWTLPVGAQVGRVIEINGTLPVNLLVGVYYDSLQPQFGSRWQLRTAAALMF